MKEAIELNKEVNQMADIRISKEEFQEYERIRLSGLTNMFHIKRVESLSLGVLSQNKIIYIMENYEQLMKEYPDVRQ